MKKIIDNIYGYICYITDLKNPMNVVATFCRILVYFKIFSSIILGANRAFEIFLLFINCIATLIAILGYMTFGRKGQLTRKPTIKVVSKKFSEKLNNERKDTIEFYEKMSKEEKIEILESFIETLEDSIESAKRELEELKNGE